MATYFIDPSAAVNGDGSESSPYNAIPTITSGNTYLFRCGTTLTVTAQITRPGGVNNVTFASYGSGEKPHIQGVFAVSDASNSTIQIANAVGWKLSGLRISRTLPDVYRAIAVLDLRGSTVKDCNLIVEGCDIEGGGDGIRVIDNINGTTIKNCAITGAFTDGIWCRTGSNTLIENCSVTGHGVGDEANADAIQFSEHTGLATVRGCYVEMRENTTKQGIFFQTSAGGVSVAVGNTIHKPGGGGASIAIEGAGKIINNRMTGQTLRGASITSTASGQDAVINGNLILGDWSGASYGVYLAGAFEKQAQVSGNTIIGKWQRAIFVDTGALPGASTYEGGSNLIDCLSKAGSVGVRNDSGIAITSNTDCVVNTETLASANVTLSGIVTDDPLLTDSYRPRSGSPLIGAGTHLGYVRDLDGKQRPNPPSIGAYDLAKVNYR